jgi:aspartyl-tRNA(Asn)/glutamyl-tRNA(Gln) amidotransferase subunit A
LDRGKDSARLLLNLLNARPWLLAKRKHLGQPADVHLSKLDHLDSYFGVPFSIKDCIDTAGVPSQRGSKLFAGFIPDKDATAVTRFKAAGGIPLMKTNIPEFACWFESDNLLTGRTNNPWNLDRTAGGSSGGEGAVIGAGLSLPVGLPRQRTT